MRTIDIRTTQNVTIEYELATVSDRIFAYMIDMLLIATVHTFLSSLLIRVFQIEDEGMYAFLFGFLPFFELILYHFFMELLANGQSVGKKAMGIQVVRMDGQQATIGDFLLRATFLIVDVVFSFGIIAVLLTSSSDRRQRLGDMTANTTVIKVKQNLRFILSDILKINTIDDYEPQYFDVKKLSEQDMLLIKNALNRYSEFKNDAHKKVILEVVKKVREKLDIIEEPKNKVEFLKTLLRDYIVLTR
jgi:uncharacterized RDD family membrane protein YckC